MSTEQTAVTKKEGATSLITVLKSDAMKQRFAELLPKVCTPERFARIALLCVNKTPKLLQTTQESVIQCLLDLARMGLEPDGRDAHLIPYGNKCTLIVDWKGLVRLAKQNGDVLNWVPYEVCENDFFEWRNGQVNHAIDYKKDRGKPVLYYSVVTLPGGITDTEVMTLAECNAIKARSKAGNSGPWVTDHSQMCCKTVIRRHSKRLTLSPSTNEAIAAGDDGLAEKGQAQERTFKGAPAIDVESADLLDDTPKPEAAQTEQTAEVPPEAQAAPIGNVVEGVLEKVTVKEGEGKRGKWTNYSLYIGNDKYGTFDTKVGETAKSLKGQSVSLLWKQDGEYRNALSVAPLVAAVDTPANSESTPAEDDDIPYDDDNAGQKELL